MLSFLLAAYCNGVRGYLDRSTLASSDWVIPLTIRPNSQKRCSMGGRVSASYEAYMAWQLFSTTKECKDPEKATEQFNLAQQHLENSAALLPERRVLVDFIPPQFLWEDCCSLMAKVGLGGETTELTKLVEQVNDLQHQLGTMASEYKRVSEERETVASKYERVAGQLVALKRQIAKLKVARQLSEVAAEVDES